MTKTHLQIKIDNEIQLIPIDEVKEMNEYHGDINRIYDICGSIWTNGQCEKCRIKSTKKNKVTCGKFYICQQYKVGQEEIMITLCNGKELLVDSYEYVDS